MEKVHFINKYASEIHNFVNDTVKPNIGVYLDPEDIDRIEKTLHDKISVDVSVQKSKIRFYIVEVILKEFGTLAFGVELGKPVGIK